MKAIFPGHYELAPDELRELWKKGVFVLDANVLLNLYRYPQNTRDELLRVFAQYKERLWIPHQVALEFQRNRLAVIAEQVTLYGKVRGIVDKARGSLRSGIEELQLSKRHSLINPEQFLSKSDELFQAFLNELDSLREKQPDVFQDDPIRRQLDSLLAAHVGAAPSSQEELDEIYEEGKARYAVRRPPGYTDQQKLKGDEAQYLYGALLYKGEFGDLLLWKQLLAEARNRPMSSVVFVTDDVKEDWWWLADSQGTKKIGARPELVEEIKREAGVEYFKMYTSDRFLAYASEHEGARVSKESIQHVRDIARVHAVIRSRRLSQLAHAAILDWLHLLYPEDEIRVRHTAATEYVPDFPDYIVVDSQDGTGMGFDVRAISHWTGFRDRHRKLLEEAGAAIVHKEVQSCWIVYVTAREGIVNSFYEAIRKYGDSMPQGVGVKLALLKGGPPSTAASLDWKLSIAPRST